MGYLGTPIAECAHPCHGAPTGGTSRASGQGKAAISPTRMLNDRISYTAAGGRGRVTRYGWSMETIRSPALLPRARVDSERKTIAFVDCCGFSAYTDTHGDSAGVAVYLQMRQTVERETAAVGVVVVKWMGDGVMLAADGSIAALTCIYRAMLSMRAAGSLPLRAGVTTGCVKRAPYDELDYLGSAVNRAAHLCAAAAPWQVRAGMSGENAVYFTLRAASPA